MNKKEAIKVIEILKKSYPDAKCSLDFRTPFEMLVAVCLSAQCTDDRVNKTTPSLFAKFDTPEEFANADIKELEKEKPVELVKKDNSKLADKKAGFSNVIYLATLSLVFEICFLALSLIIYK